MQIQSIASPAPVTFTTAVRSAEPGASVPAPAPFVEEHASAAARHEQSPPSLQSEKPVTEDNLRDAVDSLNKHLTPRRLEATYSVESDSRLIVVKITDMDSGDLVRQIPTRQAVNFAAALVQKSRSAETLALFDAKV